MEELVLERITECSSQLTNGRVDYVEQKLVGNGRGGKSAKCYLVIAPFFLVKYEEIH